ncbi:mannitol dehydrogenase family protein [Microbacterium sp. M28]|uniref:mannitol dehydrogenase family protein n=1 Tax=Microbacterium sp. M28 TaxID=2962064 RepID=UPI0021F3C973|nr:mannitol dehydrogenase family protein [Microbacterium sp. M28]UYO96568.1 mannitol dehydrogenase family protein [Microbacterium sp. M28]
MTAPDRAPVRIAHLGLGAFHRAHQAWYTEVVNRSGGEQWGIAAFTGRTPDAAVALAAQGCAYDLVVRGPESDAVERISSIVAAHDGADAGAWRQAMATVAVLTVTITEAGYHADGTAIARIVDGLRARRDAGAGPVAIVSCDNLDGNGALLGALVTRTADADLAAWIDDNVSFVSSVVDRITPAAADALPIAVTDDPCAIVTEPAASWILCGDFPAGRPAWELAGAEFVDDIEPYERRKLWLLNAGHTLLASLGRLRGHATVADAMTDAHCRTALADLWDDAAEVLPFDSADLDGQRTVITARFENARIRHALRQIATDAEIKLALRVVPVIRARLAVGLDAGHGELRALAAWAAVEGHDADAVVDRFDLDDDVRHELIGAIAELKGVHA